MRILIIAALCIATMQPSGAQLAEMQKRIFPNVSRALECALALRILSVQRKETAEQFAKDLDAACLAAELEIEMRGNAVMIAEALDYVAIVGVQELDLYRKALVEPQAKP